MAIELVLLGLSENNVRRFGFVDMIVSPLGSRKLCRRIGSDEMYVLHSGSVTRATSIDPRIIVSFGAGSITLKVGTFPCTACDLDPRVLIQA